MTVLLLCYRLATCLPELKVFTASILLWEFEPLTCMPWGKQADLRTQKTRHAEEHERDRDERERDAAAAAKERALLVSGHQRALHLLKDEAAKRYTEYEEERGRREQAEK